MKKKLAQLIEDYADVFSQHKQKGRTTKRTGEKPRQWRTDQSITDRNQMPVTNHPTNTHEANGENPGYIVAMKHNKLNYKATKSGRLNQAY